MEHEDILWACSQDLTTTAYTEPIQTTSNTHIYFCKTNLSLFLPPTHKPFKLLYPFPIKQIFSFLALSIVIRIT
jgi:hypothetical protein